MAEQPLATYRERLLRVRRDFALYGDRVVVHARWLPAGRYQSTIRLSTLKARPRTLLIRQKEYRWAGWMLALGLLLLAVMFYQSGGQSLPPLGVAGGIVAALGALLMWLTAGKITFVRFDPVEGRGGLDIGCRGPDAGRFEEFVQRVSRQIGREGK
jgi:hypothetical protein